MSIELAERVEDGGRRFMIDMVGNIIGTLSYTREHLNINNKNVGFLLNSKPPKIKNNRQPTREP